jgi:deoxyribodipyrimidine photo-lyase
MKCVIYWFRRDFRITDNTALAAAAASGNEVIPIYITSDWKGGHMWTGPARQEFLCGSLEALSKNLTAIGSRLIIRRGDAVMELERLAAETGACAIFANRDPDPFGRNVETRLEQMTRQLGIELSLHKDVCIHERDEVLTGQGTPSGSSLPIPRSGSDFQSQLQDLPSGSSSRPMGSIPCLCPGFPTGV